MAVVAIGVKLSSPGPIIFRQNRTGLDGDIIQVYKFRSMTTQDNGAVVKQARADLKSHRGKRELKIYRKALKDRRDKTVLQKWRCVHDGPP